MHGLSSPLAPCGGASDTDDNDVKRGDDMTSWLVNAIMGSRVWEHGRNAIFIVFDEGNGPTTCPYDHDKGTSIAPHSLLPAAECYDPATQTVTTCNLPCDGASANLTQPDFLVVSIPSGYTVNPRVPYVLNQEIPLMPFVRVPFGGT